MEKVNKLLLPFLTGIICAAVFRRIAARFFLPFLPMPWILGMTVLLLLLIWIFRPGKQWMIFAIAIDLITFGWQKLFHLQMIVPLGVLDLPFSSLSGAELTWAYFRASYPYTVAIGISQMISAWLLLFPRTRLVGVIMLVPILVNIILIDAFYNVGIGVLIHGIFLFAGVLYLLFENYRELVRFFFPKTGERIYTAVPVFAAVFPFLLMITVDNRNPHPQLYGKYKVKGSPVTTVYFDLDNEIVLQWNDTDHRYIGHYQYREGTDSLTATWHYPASTNRPLKGILQSGGTPGTLTFVGTLGNDSLHLDMTRL